MLDSRCPAHCSAAFRSKRAVGALAVVGVFIGSPIVQYVSQSVLKRTFAMLFIVVTGFILVQNTRPHRQSASAVQQSHRLPAAHVR